MPYMSLFWENIASSWGSINYLIYFIFLQVWKAPNTFCMYVRCNPKGIKWNKIGDVKESKTQSKLF